MSELIRKLLRPLPGEKPPKKSEVTDEDLAHLGLRWFDHSDISYCGSSSALPPSSTDVMSLSATSRLVVNLLIVALVKSDDSRRGEAIEDLRRSFVDNEVRDSTRKLIVKELLDVLSSEEPLTAAKAYSTAECILHDGKQGSRREFRDLQRSFETLLDAQTMSRALRGCIGRSATFFNEHFVSHLTRPLCDVLEADSGVRLIGKVKSDFLVSVCKTMPRELKEVLENCDERFSIGHAPVILPFLAGEIKRIDSSKDDKHWMPILASYLYQLQSDLISLVIRLEEQGFAAPRVPLGLPLSLTLRIWGKVYGEAYAIYCEPAIFCDSSSGVETDSPTFHTLPALSFEFIGQDDTIQYLQSFLERITKLNLVLIGIGRLYHKSIASYSSFLRQNISCLNLKHVEHFKFPQLEESNDSWDAGDIDDFKDSNYDLPQRRRETKFAKNVSTNEVPTIESDPTISALELLNSDPQTAEVKLLSHTENGKVILDKRMNQYTVYKIPSDMEDAQREFQALVHLCASQITSVPLLKRYWKHKIPTEEIVIELGFITSRPIVTSQDFTRYSYGLVKVLADIHQHNVIHSDVRPSNVVYDQSGTVILIDFGMAQIMDVDNRVPLIGCTANFAAPEILRCSPKKLEELRLSSKADVFSAGMTLLWILLQPSQEQWSASAVIQFLRENSSEQLKTRICNAFQEQRFTDQNLKENGANLLESAIDLIVNMLILDEMDRPTCVTLLSHYFIQNYCKVN